MEHGWQTVTAAGSNEGKASGMWVLPGTPEVLGLPFNFRWGLWADRTAVSPYAREHVLRLCWKRLRVWTRTLKSQRTCGSCRRRVSLREVEPVSQPSPKSISRVPNCPSPKGFYIVFKNVKHNYSNKRNVIFVDGSKGWDNLPVPCLHILFTYLFKRF